MDITGDWNFTEEFGYGKDQGEASFAQNGSSFTGVLEFEEKIDEEMPFTIRCQVKGELHLNQVRIEVTSFEVIDSSEPIDYYPEVREGIINADGQIVGSSEDSQGICGVFVFTRK